jgi:VCBS repeat-containing protein
LSTGPAITLTAVYTDPDIGDSHSFTINTANTKGSVTNNGDGTFTYNPNGAFVDLKRGKTATDSFSYTVTDGEGLSSTAVATITVTGAGVGKAPVANPDGPYTATLNKPLVVDAKSGLLANDTGTAGEKLRVVLVQPPSHGKLVLNKDGSFCYIADRGYVGSDSFTYRAVDASGVSAPATVSIDVQNTLTLRVAADDFEGGASLTVAVDGVEVGGVQTVTSSFAAGQHTDIALSGDFPVDPKQVTVTFINDLYEGTPQTDRNLYVESLFIDGHVFLGAAAVNPVGHAVGSVAELLSNGTITFNVQPAGLQTLTQADGAVTSTLHPSRAPQNPTAKAGRVLPTRHPASPPDIQILSAIVARGFVLTGTEPETEPWVVSLVRGQAAATGAGGGRKPVVVDLSGNNANKGSTPCAS